MDQTTDIRKCATGTIPLKGEFIARVQLAGIAGMDFDCPFQVSDNETTRNLLGRRAFPGLLDFNWVKFFQDGTVMIEGSNFLVETKRKLMSDALQYKTLAFHIEVIVDGQKIQMLLDTGATSSITELNKWREMGRPDIHPVDRKMSSTSKETVLLLGECTINIKYNGKDVHLPLLVADDVKMPAIIGANWFSALNFNFNAIFIGIQFCRPITKEATAESTGKSLPEVETKSKMRAKIVYDLDDIKPAKDYHQRCPDPQSL